MISNLDQVRDKYHYLQTKISDIEVIKNQEQYKKFARELKELEPIVQVYEEYSRCLDKLKECEEVLGDSAEDQELKDLAAEEQAQEIAHRDVLQEKLKYLMVPRDPDDNKNVIVEIRAGTGGEEASLFAYDLFRMYTRYAERTGYGIDVINLNESDRGGIKEVTFLVQGDAAYGDFKYEKGVHRVQRVPETESSGRIHTSAVTVAVLPETTEEEVDINESELKIDTFRASGAGGQHVNKTDSAVRITHIPSGTVVVCQDEKSQHKNKTKAMKVLRSRIYEQVKSDQEKETARDRKDQVGSGDRSEKIRTYNFPQSRVTDHRTGKTIHKLDIFLDGDMKEIIESLKMDEKEKKLVDVQL